MGSPLKCKSWHSCPTRRPMQVHLKHFMAVFPKGNGVCSFGQCCRGPTSPQRPGLPGATIARVLSRLDTLGRVPESVCSIPPLSLCVLPNGGMAEACIEF